MEIHEAERVLIYEHAESEYPDECCGVLLGIKENSLVCKIVPLDNTDEYGRRNIHYTINPLDIYKLECEAADEGLEILGFYHSHADYPAIPSAEDTRYMIPGCSYVIVSVDKKRCVDMRIYEKEAVYDELDI